MKTIYRFACVLAAALTFAAAGCGEDDEPTSGKNNTGEQLNPEGDPEGTVTVNIGNDGGYLYIDEGGVQIAMTDDNNFIVRAINQLPYCSSNLSSIGKVPGLSFVRTAPKSGWDSEMLAQSEYGYVLRTADNSEEFMYNIYTRLYVEEYMTNTAGGIIGARVKYQAPFYPDNTLCFEYRNAYLCESNNYADTLKILHYIPFTVDVQVLSGNLNPSDLKVEWTEEEITFSYTNYYDIGDMVAIFNDQTNTEQRIPVSIRIK